MEVVFDTCAVSTGTTAPVISSHIVAPSPSATSTSPVEINPVKVDGTIKNVVLYTSESLGVYITGILNPMRKIYDTKDAYHSVLNIKTG